MKRDCRHCGQYPCICTYDVNDSQNGHPLGRENAVTPRKDPVGLCGAQILHSENDVTETPPKLTRSWSGESGSRGGGERPAS